MNAHTQKKQITSLFCKSLISITGSGLSIHYGRKFFTLQQDSRKKPLFTTILKPLT